MLALDVTEGAVVGVLGPWGSGKTSFVNLARAHLESQGATIVDFNPWMFSGAEQLVESFFIEISAQLKLRKDLSDIGDELANYGDMFSGMGGWPIVGPWIERAHVVSKFVAGFLQRRQLGVKAQRIKVEQVLRALNHPLVVVLDDIDRLTTDEIRHIFRLVRLTASFPNVIYVLAFDRNRVESALGEHGIVGRDYLEKILQIGFDLPAVPPHTLTRETAKAIDSVLSDIENPGRFDEDLWPDVSLEIIRPLIRNLRDVRRYAIAVRGKVRALEGHAALVDVLALEAVRVFLPDVFCELPRSVDGLTSTTDTSRGRRSGEEALKSQVERLIHVSGDHFEVVRALVRRLFQAGQRHLGDSTFGSDWKALWLQERRVAHEVILRLYLEQDVGEELQAFVDAEQAWSRLAHREDFDSYLRSLPFERLEEVISNLEMFEKQFATEHVVPGSIVLLNLLRDLPERRKGMFELDTETVVTRVVYRLVRSLKEPGAIAASVRGVLPQIATLSSKLKLITIVGHRKGQGHGLVTEAVATALERDWRAQVRAASVESLAAEDDLLRVLLLVKQDATHDEPPIEIAASPQLTLAILRSAQSESRSQEEGSRAIRRVPRLAWDELVELYGDESTLIERIEELKSSRPEGHDELIALVEKFVRGEAALNGGVQD